MSRKIRFDPRTGDLIYTIRNRGLGAYQIRQRFRPQCHICSIGGELHRCQHCAFLACQAHYNPEFRVCTDCSVYYRNAQLHEAQEVEIE